MSLISFRDRREEKKKKNPAKVNINYCTQNDVVLREKKKKKKRKGF